MLEKIFEILGISGEEKEKLIKVYEEMVTNNLNSRFVESLSPEQLGALGDEVKKGKEFKQVLEEWLKSNPEIDDRLKKELEAEVVQTNSDFVKSLMDSVTEDKQKEVVSYLESLVNE